MANLYADNLIKLEEDLKKMIDLGYKKYKLNKKATGQVKIYEKYL